MKYEYLKKELKNIESIENVLKHAKNCKDTNIDPKFQLVVMNNTNGMMLTEEVTVDVLNFLVKLYNEKISLIENGNK